MTLRAAFLDRDGVINVDSGYVSRWDDFEYLPNVVEGMKVLQNAGFELVVVTNQSGIARGYYSEADFLFLSEMMKADLASKGVTLLSVYYCPYLEDADLEAYRQASELRKPEPGMLLKAAEEHGLDLARSIMVGDKASDMLAAERAGVPDRYHLTEEAPYKASMRVSSLLEAALEATGQST